MTLLAWVALSMPAAMPPADAPTLAELAAEADTVVLVRVVETHYGVTGPGMVTGDARVEVLTEYQGDLEVPQILVHEDGEPGSICHMAAPREFPDRYLLFLRRNPGGSYARLACPLRVAATEVGAYALIFPLRYVNLGGGVDVRELRYADPTAFVPAEHLGTLAEIEHQREAFLAEDREGGMIYTRGVLLREIFSLLRGR